MLLIRRYFIFVFYLCSSLSLLQARQEESLPASLGKSSCVIVKTEKIRANPRALTLTKISKCSAALVSRSQIVTDSDCLSSKRTEQVKFQISCHGQQFQQTLKPISNTHELEKNLSLLRLEVPSPYYAEPINNNPLERHHWLETEKAKDCRFTGVEKEHEYSNDLKELEVGSLLKCKDNQGDDHVLGIVNRNEEIVYFDQLPLETLLNTKDIYTTQQMGRFELTHHLCREGQKCLFQLESQIEKLSEQTLSLLDELKEQMRQISLDQAYEELHQQFLELLLSCQEADSGQREYVSKEKGTLAKLAGKIQSTSLNLIEKYNDEYLHEKFSEIDIINDHLDHEHIKEVIQGIDQREDYDGQIERIASITKELSRDVLTNILDDNDYHIDQNKRQDIWRESSKNYLPCLDQALNTDEIEECAEIFSKDAAPLIARLELEHQVSKTFKDFYQTEKDFQGLELETLVSFNQCLEDYYNQDINTQNTQVKDEDKAKSCVFRGLLSGYKRTVRDQIYVNLKDIELSNNDYQQIEKEILHNAQDCEYGELFYQDRFQSNDYDTLSKLTPEVFETSLKNCSRRLGDVAGEKIISLTLFETPELKQNYSRDEIQELSIKVKEELYRPCIEAQGTDEQVSPQKCEDLIENHVSLEVAKSLMKKSLEEQISSLQTYTDSQKESYLNEYSRTVSDIMSACQDDVRSADLSQITNSNNSQQEKRPLDCVDKGIRYIAQNVSALAIRDGVLLSDQTSSVSEQILSLPSIQGLPQKTAECFSESLKEVEDVRALSSSLDKISSLCTLNIEKQVSIIGLESVLEKRITPHMTETQQRSEFIEELINSDNGLKMRIEQTRTKSQLEKTLDEIPTEVTLKVATQSIPGLVDHHLTGVLDVTERSEIADELLQKLTRCLEEQKSLESKINNCSNLTSAQGHLDIFKEIVQHMAYKTLGHDEQKAQDLAKVSKQRLKKCLRPISYSLDSNEYDKKLQECVSIEVGLVSRDIPKEVLVKNKVLLASALSEPELRRQLNDVDDFYLGNGDLENVNEDNELVLVYMSLNTCITARRSELRHQRLSLEKVQAIYKRCTDKFEDRIKTNIVKNFVQKDYPYKQEKHEAALDKAGNLLIELATQESPGPSSQKEAATKTQTLDYTSLLQTVGEMTIQACLYSEQLCHDALDQSLDSLNESPGAPQKTPQEIFSELPLSEILIESQIATLLNVELKKSLESYSEDTSILNAQIDKATSPEVIQGVFKNRYGQVLQELIKQKINGGEIEDIQNDQRIRKTLALALIEDTNHESFIDHIVYGLVQPELNQQRESSSGPSGLFQNTKVTLGRLFGIVDGKNFDWQRIRETPEGKRARKLFSEEIFLPQLTQTQPERAPTGHSDKKALQRYKVDELSELIEEGLKRLSD